MITRIFVIARERGPILLGNAACQWLGLIAVLIKNKAPVVGRFVAAVTRGETEGGEVEAYPILKTGDDAEITKSQPQPLKATTAAKNEEETDHKGKISGTSFGTFGHHSGDHRKVSLSHLHLRGMNQTAHKSKTRSFQEVIRK